MCCHFLLLSLLYYVYKYLNYHFHFMNASKGIFTPTSLVSLAFSDGLNIIQFTLRFAMPMIQLNIYDGIDGVLDGYDIFITDFGETEYHPDSSFSPDSTSPLDTNMSGNRLFSLDDKLDIFNEIFSIYYTIWTNFAFYYLPVVEEVFRLGLPLHITFSLISEVSMISRSYKRTLT